MNSEQKLYLDELGHFRDQKSLCGNDDPVVILETCHNTRNSW